MAILKKFSLGVLIIFVGLTVFLKIEGFPGSFARTVIKTEPMPPDSFNSPEMPHTVIYVLGGSEQSLVGRFKTASDLYHKRLASKIIILSRAGITAYSPALGRNLTNDEWSTAKLQSFGVRKPDIEAVKIADGFFGTLSEAESIPNLVSNRGYTTLILVSSKYHTMRVWESFSKFSGDKNLRLFIYTSDDHSGLYALLKEYFKLEFYRLFLIGGFSTAT